MKPGVWLRAAMPLVCAAWCACERSASPPVRQVVVYTALDRSFSEPILAEFERRTGIRTLAVYDVESTKSVGLANRIRSERRRPRCDVFWNNEILNTLSMKREGLLRAIHPTNAELYPAEVRDPEGLWYGFAARARVLLVNARLVPEDAMPRSMFDLLDPRWRGQIGLARPVAGTTATHVASLFAVLGEVRAREYLLGLRSNQVRLESGNKSCAENVARGVLSVAWTDTDDAIIEVEAGSEVRIVFPDKGPDDLGTLFIPNTLAAIKDSPNPREADQLIDFLLSSEVEERLAAGPSAQIPLNRQSPARGRLPGLKEVRRMQVNFAEASQAWEAAQRFVREELLR